VQVLTNSADEPEVFLPLVQPFRPVFGDAPLCVELVMVWRAWQHLDTKYLQIPVHVSNAYLSLQVGAGTSQKPGGCDKTRRWDDSSEHQGRLSFSWHSSTPSISRSRSTSPTPTSACRWGVQPNAGGLGQGGVHLLLKAVQEEEGDDGSDNSHEERSLMGVSCQR
jgi:hypothetical protein